MQQPLFFNFKERVYFLAFLLVIFACTIGLKYYSFHKLKSQNNPEITAQILLQYEKTKNNKTYFVLKLQSDFGTFYTTSKEDLKDLQFRYVSLRLITKRIIFLDFLKGFYAPHFNLILLPKRDYREPFREFILNQHNSKIMGEYHLALLLSDGLPKLWRDFVQSYGIAHIFAISGFHVGILGGICFFIIGIFYKPLHKRFFPFRNYFFDIGLVALLMLFGYYFLLTQSPSYLRAVAMSAVGFFLLTRGLNILKLESIFWCILILLAFIPNLMFSLAFYFSCFGVLYVFLFFKYFPFPKTKLGGIFYALLLNIFTSIFLLCIGHFFFAPFSPFVLLSPFITILFCVYYPLMILAHLIGFGGFLDTLLLWWLNTNPSVIFLSSNVYFFVLCHILTLFACFYRFAFYALFALNLGFLVYGLYLYF